MRAFNGTADDRRIWAKTQTMGVYALGIQGIAIITQSSQNEDASGGDTNAPTQTNPVTTTAGK